MHVQSIINFQKLNIGGKCMSSHYSLTISKIQVKEFKRIYKFKHSQTMGKNVTDKRKILENKKRSDSN